MYNPLDAEYWRLGGADRLNHFGDWAIIDSLCKTYNYKHDEVFVLSWAEVMTMTAYNRELSYVEANSLEIKRKAEKKN